MTQPSPPPSVTERSIADLRARLAAYRPVAVPSAAPWERGVDPEYLADVLTTWADEYDWASFDERVQSLPWVVAGAADAPVRIVHHPAPDPAAPVVVLLHGWPDSVFRFTGVLPLLRDVHVVVPALPGYPFAAPTDRPIRSAADMARAIADAVADLGHERYVVSAGDVGADVAEHLAASRPDRVSALHLTELSHHHADQVPPEDLDAEERRYVDALHRWHETEGGYNHEQSTKPATLAVGLGDSPAGLAAWILEKLHGWSDHGGDVERVFPRPELLDWISAYWVSAAIGTSFSPYANRVDPGPIGVPAAFTIMPADIVTAPRSFAERFLDVRSWRVAEAGGHFDAWERPLDYVEGIRRALAIA